MSIFSKNEREKTSPKFRPGDLVFSKKDNEKLCILRVITDIDDRDADMGIEYVARGDDHKKKRIFEIELATLDEMVDSSHRHRELSYK